MVPDSLSCVIQVVTESCFKAELFAAAAKLKAYLFEISGLPDTWDELYGAI